MKQISNLEIKKKLKNNGYTLVRTKGSHYIYSNGKDTIAVPYKIKSVIALRLIKEYSLS